MPCGRHEAGVIGMAHKYGVLGGAYMQIDGVDIGVIGGWDGGYMHMSCVSRSRWGWGVGCGCGVGYMQTGGVDVGVGYGDDTMVRGVGSGDDVGVGRLRAQSGGDVRYPELKELWTVARCVVDAGQCQPMILEVVVASRHRTGGFSSTVRAVRGGEDGEQRVAQGGRGGQRVRARSARSGKDGEEGWCGAGQRGWGSAMCRMVGGGEKCVGGVMLATYHAKQRRQHPQQHLRQHPRQHSRPADGTKVMVTH
ncbi:hypothetical protein GGX14DRAFT_386212 [Mycena pura]|uniref:Uncharacterized protein n=1 Tax=Mycena pura TaxID=153505 RepID=A0AAD6YNW7_9AGAR|nr:hypothetical protein GGX14DRAFT_386212 [Mycena pura]